MMIELTVSHTLLGYFVLGPFHYKIENFITSIIKVLLLQPFQEGYIMR